MPHTQEEVRSLPLAPLFFCFYFILFNQAGRQAGRQSTSMGMGFSMGMGMGMGQCQMQNACKDASKC